MGEYDTSSLLYFLNRFENLESKEFVDMVAEVLSSRGWKDISITSRSGDKKCDIIGFDQKGRKVYVLAKKRDEEIDQPVIQQLHSIMLADNIEKGIVVTTSKFTPKALKYVNNINNNTENQTNINLINGKELIEICKYIVSNVERSDSLCVPINLDKMKEDAFEIFNAKIFTYPKPASFFIENLNVLNCYFEPYFYVIFSIDEYFEKKSINFFYHMNIPKSLAIFSTHGEMVNYKFPNFNLEQLTDLENIERKLERNKISYHKKTEVNLNLHNIKTYIQRAFAVKRTYRGQDHETHIRICRPNLKNIIIHENCMYWELHTTFEIQLMNSILLRVLFKDDSITGLNCVDYPTKKQKPKIVRMCQRCQALMFKGAPKKEFLICQDCGTILCEDCAYIIEKKRIICEDCIEKRKNGLIPEKEDKQVIKTVKESFQNWKKNKTVVQLKFVNS